MNTFQEIIELFKGCATPQLRYQKIIELGSKLPPMPLEHKTEDTIVPGCQSVVYMYARQEREVIRLTASSDALISAGLAMLLLLAYDGKSPEFILKNPPTFLERLQIASSLSPGRSNGVASMYRHMQKSALNFLVTP